MSLENLDDVKQELEKVDCIDEGDPTKIFKILAQLGKGQFGSVVKAVDTRDDMLVAVKIITTIEPQDIVPLALEAACLKNFEHDNIVKYKGTFIQDGVWIAMEFCGLGSLFDLPRICKFKFKEQHVASIMKSCLEALSHVHGRRVIHRDIKGANILLNEQGVCKLADFGVSAQVASIWAQRSTTIGTPYWMAPEMMNSTAEKQAGKGYDKSVDIWALGITAMELMNGRPPLMGMGAMQALLKISQGTKPGEENIWSLPASDTVSEQLSDFVSRCLRREASARPDAEALLKHPFIKDVDQECLPALAKQHAKTVENHFKGSLKKASQDVDSLIARAVLEQEGLGVRRHTTGDFGAQETQEQLERFRKAVKVSDRSYHLRSYKNVFVGSEAVKALVSSGVVATPAEAVKLGNRLLDHGMFTHVANEHRFKDKFLFYRFSIDDKEARKTKLITGITVGTNFWNARSPHKLKRGGFELGEIGVQTSLVRRANGTFVLLDCIDLTQGGAKAQLDGLTDGGKKLAAVLMLHPFHAIHLKAFRKAYPKVACYGTPRHLRHLPNVPWQGDLNDEDTRKLFLPDLDLRVVPGCELVNPLPPISNHFASVLAFHPLSKTLHVDDTLQYSPTKPTAMLRLAGFKKSRLIFHQSMSKALEDPPLFEAFIEKILKDWDIENIACAHQGTKIGEGHAMLTELLERSKPLLARLAKKRCGDGTMKESRANIHEHTGGNLSDVLASLNDSDFCG